MANVRIVFVLKNGVEIARHHKTTSTCPNGRLAEGLVHWEAPVRGLARNTGPFGAPEGRGIPEPPTTVVPHQESLPSCLGTHNGMRKLSGHPWGGGGGTG